MRYIFIFPTKVIEGCSCLVNKRVGGTIWDESHKRVRRKVDIKLDDINFRLFNMRRRFRI